MAERVHINLKIAQEIINSLQESWAGSFNPFLQVVAAAYKNQTNEDINFQNFRLRIQSGALTCSVKPGKRGRKPGQALSTEHKAALQAGRQAKPSKAKVEGTELNKMAMKALIEKAGKRYPKLVAAILKGSRAAAVKLHCIFCVGEERVSEQVGNCTCYICPLYLFRPYQKADEKDDTNED